jgi:hypothetical protein
VPKHPATKATLREAAAAEAELDIAALTGLGIEGAAKEDFTFPALKQPGARPCPVAEEA